MNNKGYEGSCSRCSQKIRAYYVFADSRRRAMMDDGTFMLEDSNCPQCVTSKLLVTPRTIKWKRQLSVKEVEADLKKHMSGGINIDFEAADREAKQNELNDKWLENNEKRVAERLAWNKKTENGVQKYFH